MGGCGKDVHEDLVKAAVTRPSDLSLLTCKMGLRCLALRRK